MSQKSTAVAVISDRSNLETLLNNGRFQESLVTVLPKHLTAERVVKMALVAASRQPLLFKCTQESVLKALMTAAELGIDCSGTLGRGYLVPYFNSKLGAYEAQFIVGYQGLIELARRSGNIARIESRVVYDGDFFDVEYGLDQKLTHRPKLGSERGEMTCVYAIAELTDGSRQIEVMSIADVEAIRLRSKAKDNGPWKTDYAEMARKTVIRRMAKYLPLSTEVVSAISSDDDQFPQSAAYEMAENTKRRVVEMKERLEAVPAELTEGDAPDVPEADEETENARLELDRLLGIKFDGDVNEIDKFLAGRDVNAMDLAQLAELKAELSKL